MTGKYSIRDLEKLSGIKAHHSNLGIAIWLTYSFAHGYEYPTLLQ